MTMLNFFLGEMLGTAVLVLLGNGVVMNVSFKKTLGHGGGLMVALFAWAMAVFAGILVAQIFEPNGHINPAITVAQMVGGNMAVDMGFVGIASQLLGALIGQSILVIFYWQHIKDEPIDVVLTGFVTNTSHPDKQFNALFSEYFGTVLLALAVIFAIPWASATVSGSFGTILGALACGFVVFGIGASLGGVTNWAINPARDIMPRILHFVMYKIFIKRGVVEAPAKGETISNWKYAWVPVTGPLAAGVTLGAFLYC